LFCLILGSATTPLAAQTIGGAAAYNFLHLPATPAQTAVGGVNVSLANDDIGLALNNPALLKSSLHGQLGINFNSFFAGIKAYQLGGVWHHEQSGTTFGGGIFYLDYGSLTQTDIYGNETGSFRPVDYSIQLSAARAYGNRIRYGVTAKLINSNYGIYRSRALAFDVGLHYNDTASRFSAGLVARNMGGQLKTYSGTAEDLPFDLQAGVSKRLEKAPFGFSLTFQHLHRFNTDFNDPSFVSENGTTHRSAFGRRLTNHIVLATHVYLGRNLEVHVGYNFLRRRELNVGSGGNGLNGFSAGFRARFSRLQFQYARAAYQRGRSYNQFGIQLPLTRKV